METNTDNLNQYKVASWLPTGCRGAWKIERFSVSKSDSDVDRLRAAIGGHDRWCLPGMYTRLVGPISTPAESAVGDRKFGVVMSDTRNEIEDHLGFMSRASGSVLIHGLGLGMVAAACLRNPKVESVTVVELSEDVIALVEPHLRAAFPGRRLHVICGDAFTWRVPRGQRWTCAWHDIWPAISADNLVEMRKLHRRFSGRVTWQGSWAYHLCARENLLEKDARRDLLRRASAMFGSDVAAEVRKRLG